MNDTKVNATVDGEIAGSIVFERVFSYGNTSLPTSTDTLVFTGIKGKLLFKIKLEKRDKSGDFGTITDVDVSEEDINGDPEAIEFDLIPGFTINFNEQIVFDKSLIKSLM